ncbi:hypothetical protein Agabi119p4_6402 [Agaricus bisporus var. burnettii]|uniref:Deacetylase sirtuin-type domain-containing protein n=1 Tax=Agaricus bisporus var. burnettii TaxID=192524 RepID=A0A8H7C9Z2_AGABI|nr:hypothetical protein Agabi119p4_6402 [Agaricus bisporus var. burnettii]
MRLSVPRVPNFVLSTSTSTPRTSHSEAVERIAEFIKPGNVTVLTGAGVSVDSGIRAYRGHDGRYMNPNYKPILYHELMDETMKGHAFRQRYWLRSYFGYPPVRDALPNTTHHALAALQHAGIVSHLITQNVDRLHHKALLNQAPSNWLPSKLTPSILELHGTLSNVCCNHGHVIDRDSFQDMISISNPKWVTFAKEIEQSGIPLKTNPDGDVDLGQFGFSHSDFQIPECAQCLKENRRNTIVKIKPQVIFFGETIPLSIKEASYNAIDSSDRLLIVGTTLATYSAFRLLKRALETHKDVTVLNLGPTRADGILAAQKIEHHSGLVLRDAAKSVWYVVAASIDAPH